MTSEVLDIGFRFEVLGMQKGESSIEMIEFG